MGERVGREGGMEGWRRMAESRIAQMTFWRSGLEVTPKSPRFKPVALFKMQTWQIWTKKNKLKKIKIYIFSNNVLKGHLYQQRRSRRR